MTKASPDSATRLGTLAVALTVLVWVLGAAFLPVTQDEAYYFDWARHLSLGYFDHPPLVALAAALGRLAPIPGVERLGNILLGLALVVANRWLFRCVGLDRNSQALALCLSLGNLMGLAVGILATPDTGLILAWTLSLASAAQALDDRRVTTRPRAWLLTGAATALGLWAKYTMLLIGPVLLWALWQERQRALTAQRRPQFLTPWPYLGGILALILIFPHLQWQSDHDWVTFRFQLRHGLAAEHASLATSAAATEDLPEPEEADPGGPEQRLAQPFVDLAAKEAKEEKAPKVYDEVLSALNRYVGFLASQFALWGALAVAVLLALRQATGERNQARAVRAAAAPPEDPGSTWAPGSRHLLKASVAVPLLLFGAMSFVTKVEANWSAMYVTAAAALLAPYLVHRLRMVRLGLVANLLAIGLVLLHARTGILPTRPHRDRVLGETHGWLELASWLKAHASLPLLADSYQATAMLRHYRAARDVWQWPGITRDSDFVRRQQQDPGPRLAIDLHGGFELVTTDLPPPHFAGFEPRSLTQLRDCKGADLQVISSHAALNARDRCLKPVHEWYLIEYRANLAPAN